MKKIILSSLSVVTFILIVLACSKDRSILLPKDTQSAEPEVPAVKTIKDFTFDGKDAQAFLSKLANKSETKTIKSQSDLPFVGKNGTKVWIYPNDLTLPDGSRATYPFDLEILELLTPKDMILNQKPTVSQGRLLTTGGELFIKATKGGKELTLNYNNNTYVELLSKNVVSEMSLFYGTTGSNGVVDWIIEKPDQRREPSGIVAVDSPKVGNPKQYYFFPSQIGWINCDKFANFQGAKTKIKFTSAYPELKEIQAFLFFPDLKSVMQVYNGTSGDIPVGQLVKIICIAVTKEEQIFSFTKDVVVTDNQNVTIELKPTTQKELDDYLKTLSF